MLFRLIFIIFFLLECQFTFATEQVPDIIYYNGAKYQLDTGWGHPSPLETYFSQNNIRSPFTWLSTANYRGHIATWKIEKNRLFLNSIQVDEDIFKPVDYNIISKNTDFNSDDNVFADWFSGVLLIEVPNKKNRWEIEKQYYAHVQFGVIQDIQELAKNDYEKIEKMFKEERTDEALLDKYKMLILNDNYVSYYFRLGSKDSVIVDERGGYFRGSRGMSPLLQKYQYDHMEWPFNWENLNKNGAPRCHWTIQNDSLYIQSIELYTGTGFYEIDKYEVEFIELFPSISSNGFVFAEWLNGTFIISYGEEVKDDFGLTDFKPSEHLIFRVKNGIIIEKYSLPGDFNFRKVPNKMGDSLKSLISEFSRG